MGIVDAPRVWPELEIVHLEEVATEKAVRVRVLWAALRSRGAICAPMPSGVDTRIALLSLRMELSLRDWAGRVDDAGVLPSPCEGLCVPKASSVPTPDRIIYSQDDRPECFCLRLFALPCKSKIRLEAQNAILRTSVDCIRAQDTKSRSLHQ